MTFKTTLMATSKFLFAWATAVRQWLTTQNRRVELSNSTRTKNWFNRNPFARFAESEMTEVCAIMLTAA